MSTATPSSRPAPTETDTASGTDPVASARRVSRVVLGNAMSLFGTTIVTSVAGFAFWWVAARLFDPSAVGSGGAAVSAVQLLATIGMLGLGTLTIGELSKRDSTGQSLLSTALLTSTTAGLALGVGFVALVRVTSASARDVPAGTLGAAVFIAAVGVTAGLLVLDDATLGLSRARWQLWRNLAFSLLKLGALPVAALILDVDGPASLVGAWLSGALVSTSLVVWLARRERVKLLARPRWALVRTHTRGALAHHWLNLSAAAPRLLLPVLVAAFLTPAVNASFYTALLLVGFAYTIPSQLTTALFALASGDRGALGEAIRGTLRISGMVAVASAIGFATLGHFMLSIFGHHYASATGSLAILGTATFATAIKSHYMAVCRVNGDLSRCAAVSVAATIFEIALPAMALVLGGRLLAVSLMWVIGMFVEAAVLWPSVAVASRLPGGSARFNRLVRWSAPRTFRAADAVEVGAATN